VRPRTSFRIAIALVALAGSAEPALAAGAPPGPTRALTLSGLSFRYPVAWTPSPAAWRWHSTFTSVVTYLSTQPMRDPCTRVGSSTTCATPVTVLKPAAVLVTWSRNATPGWSLVKQPGRKALLAGRSGRILIARPGTCSYLHAEETVTAQIALGQKGGSVQMLACLRGPSLALNERRVLAMLQTLRVSG
jgi:hypothetical protein